ncbi:MAG: chemotaxis protein [Alphaproteobacteria bacterium]|nr:chemotaxis protein [Alphaproteobacteria bacterium]
MAEPERIVELSRAVSEIAGDKIKVIKTVTGATKILALNALIEASRAGEAGKGFAVVASEVKTISTQIANVTQELENELTSRVLELTRLGELMVSHVRGTRLMDLAYNMIEIIDRNLYERSCDVRWWATDSALTDCLSQGTEQAADWASRRLGVILDSYTVYLDLWVADAQGRVIASGRPGRFRATGADVSRQGWFQEAMNTRDGNEFAVADITSNEILGGVPVATYATAIREGGHADGRPLGALGIFFDWEAQARSVVEGVRLTPEEKERTRCLLIDSNERVIAASDGRGVLSESFRLNGAGGQAMGTYTAERGRIVGFAQTPGYETYRGLGWYGVIVQEPLAS